MLEIVALVVLEAVALVVLTCTFVMATGRIATAKRRSPKGWMWSAAILGPLPLAVLALLPAKRQGRPA
jgi:hypothetical protein